MKFSIDRGVVDEALKSVQFALLTRPSLPILNNVKITANSDSVTFLLTDLEIAISCTAEADIESEGEITVPSRTLISIIRRLPERPVMFTLEEDEFIEMFKTSRLDLSGQFAAIEFLVTNNLTSGIMMGMGLDPHAWPTGCGGTPRSLAISPALA